MEEYLPMSTKSNAVNTVIVHGTHSGTIAWLKHDRVIISSTPVINPTYKDVTLIHFRDGKTLQLDGLYNFRIGAKYSFQLMSPGILVLADFVT